MIDVFFEAGHFFLSPTRGEKTDLMHAAFECGFDKEALARRFGTELEVLSSGFSYGLGLTLDEWLSEQRLVSAIQLLREGWTYRQIIRWVGYQDFRYFHEEVVLRLGISPNEVRRRSSPGRNPIQGACGRVYGFGGVLFCMDVFDQPRNLNELALEVFFCPELFADELGVDLISLNQQFIESIQMGYWTWINRQRMLASKDLLFGGWRGVEVWLYLQFLSLEEFETEFRRHFQCSYMDCEMQLVLN
jgi:AraC-like DNA-binding protein